MSSVIIWALLTLIPFSGAFFPTLLAQLRTRLRDAERALRSPFSRKMRWKFTYASYQVLGIVAKPPYRSGPGLPLDRINHNEITSKMKT